ncbi:MAG: HEAT repeat domain-containing protein [Deltaproteobacteria bacterium]|nr:HEAT repeat domain-containing protein [Deltaproteobacteria bacterium]
MQTPGPAQFLDEERPASQGGSSGPGGTPTPAPDAPTPATAGPELDEERDGAGRDDEEGGRTAVLDALARGGSRGISALIGALRSAEADVVMYAATALGEVRDPAAVPHLIRLLQHPDLNVAQAAIDALGKLRAQAAAAPIEAVLEADPWLRFAAAYALGEIGHPGSVHALMRAAGDAVISESAITALGKIATVPATTVLAELLFQRASASNFDVCLLAMGNAVRRMVDRTGLDRSRAWQRLASAEASVVHARLVSMLVRREGEPSAQERVLKEAAIAVMRALALPVLCDALIEAAWDTSVGEPLLDAVVFLGAVACPAILVGLGHADADVRVFCATAAAVLGVTEAAGPCVELLASSETRVRVAALRALSGLHVENAVPVMLRCLADRAEPVRKTAVRSLGAMDASLVTRALLADPDYAQAHAPLVLEIMRIAPCAAQREFVTKSLADPREDVRRVAVGVMAASEPSDILDNLEPLLADPSVAVRAMVVQALGQRRSRRALVCLQVQFERDPETRIHALRAIGRIGDGAAAKLLIASYPEQERAVRLAIIDALGAIAAPVAEPFLAQLLCDRRPDIRGRAVVAIGQYATDGAVGRLVHATLDTDPRVRLAALESLSAFTGRPAAAESFERLCLDPVPAIAALARRCLRKG